MQEYQPVARAEDGTVLRVRSAYLEGLSEDERRIIFDLIKNLRVEVTANNVVIRPAPGYITSLSPSALVVIDTFLKQPENMNAAVDKVAYFSYLRRCGKVPELRESEGVRVNDALRRVLGKAVLGSVNLS
jgi:hypothetical protein